MIEMFRPGMEAEVAALVGRVFDLRVGKHYSGEGRKTFHDYILPDNFVERWRNGNIIIVYKKDEKITGMIELHQDNHISLFFVDQLYAGKGIGRILFDSARALVQGKTDYLTVKSSSCALPVYESLGFVQQDEEQEENGIRYTPMRMNCV